MPSVSTMMATKKMMDMAWSLTLAHLPLGRLVPRPVHQVVPPVGPAYVQVHEYPGHRELREGVDVSPRDRAYRLPVQNGREPRQNGQPEVEDEKEDRRRHDERLLLSRKLLEGRGSLDADPLLFPHHACSFLRDQTPTNPALYCMQAIRASRYKLEPAPRKRALQRQQPESL